eukprot:12420999-Karenia_brevis.AAC.1
MMMMNMMMMMMKVILVIMMMMMSKHLQERFAKGQPDNVVLKPPNEHGELLKRSTQVNNALLEFQPVVPEE